MYLGQGIESQGETGFTPGLRRKLRRSDNKMQYTVLNWTFYAVKGNWRNMNGA